MIACRHDLFWPPTDNCSSFSLWNHSAKTNREWVYTGGKSVSFWSHFKLRKRLFSSCTKSKWLNTFTTAERFQNDFFQHNQNKSRFWMSVSSDDNWKDPGVKNSYNLGTNIRVLIHTDFPDSCRLKSSIYLWQICVGQIPLRKKGSTS